MARKARKFRFHHAGELNVGNELRLDKAASHHLLTVLRATSGDQLELFNGDGFNYAASLVKDAGALANANAVVGTDEHAAANNDRNTKRVKSRRGNSSRFAIIHVESRSENLSESPLAITLVQSVSRGERMDQTIRQAVELGVVAIQPVYSRQAQKAGDEKRTGRRAEHWQKIIISAAEQSGRARLPLLHPALTFSAWIADNDIGPAASSCIVLHPKATDSFKTLPKTDQVSIAIGPESGFDDDEVDAIIKAGATACRLGPRTLRTETAGPAAIAILQAIHGDGS